MQRPCGQSAHPSLKCTLLKHSKVFYQFRKRRPDRRNWPIKFQQSPVSGGWPWQSKKKKEPIEAVVLSSILNTSSVPYSSYVPLPRTPLHSIDAHIKQIWLIAVLLLMARATSTVRLMISAGFLLLTMTQLPKDLWKAQLPGLVGLCLFLFLGSAIGADGVPPILQGRNPPPQMEGFTGALTPDGPYSFVIFNWGFINITRRSLNLAVAAACFTFTALQSASLCLVTTPAEELAVALRNFLRPFQLIGLPAQEIGFTLLLSLRFMSLVFEEVRNLCLGLAARGVDWPSLGPNGGMQVVARLSGKVFSNLLRRSENIAEAMTARGFTGPQQHRLHLTSAPQGFSLVPNLAAVVLLVGLFAFAPSV